MGMMLSHRRQLRRGFRSSSGRCEWRDSLRFSPDNFEGKKNPPPEAPAVEV